MTVEELGDCISLTDMAKVGTDSARAADVIKNRLRNRATPEFSGTRVILSNPDFKVVEFDHLKSEDGLHTFTLSVKERIERTNAVGLYVQSGRYDGTYAHRDPACEFGSAISPMFKLCFLKEYQQLKEADAAIENMLNVIYLDDDQLLLTFNFKDGTKTISFAEAGATEEKAESGLDFNCIAVPKEDKSSDRLRSGFLLTEEPNYFGNRLSLCLS